MTQAELELVAPCRVPKEGTQHHKLLRAMQAGVRLTIWNAMNDYGCGALHQRIKELREAGWPIQRRVLPGTNVAEFWMER